jgi:sugar lactone lactonase YvrE
LAGVVERAAAMSEAMLYVKGFAASLPVDGPMSSLGAGIVDTLRLAGGSPTSPTSDPTCSWPLGCVSTTSADIVSSGSVPPPPCLPSWPKKNVNVELRCPRRQARRPAALEARVSTIELPGLDIYSVLAGKGGKLFLGTRTALYLYVDGHLALIAGHSSEEGYNDGQGDEARFDCIFGLALERGGSVLVSDSGNNSVRRVSRHGQVTTVAGNGKQGFADGVGKAARFNWPDDIEVDSQGLIYVTDTQNHCVRTVQPADGTVSTLCGKGKEEGCVNGPATEARFRRPAGLALDMNEDLIVADCGNNSVRKVALPDGRVTTVAGCVEGGTAGVGYADGTGTAARFHGPHAVAVDGSNAILVADQGNNRVRKISGEGGVVTTVAGQGEAGKVDGTGPNEPFKLTIDEEGQLVVAETDNVDSLRVVEASLVPPARLAAEETAREKALRQARLALQDYGKLLGDAELAVVTFAVDGRGFPAHSQVLAARSEHFKALLTSGMGMREGGSRTAGGDIALEGLLSAGAFQVLLRYLYTQELPATEDGGEGLAVGEMAKAADYFQAVELFEHCVEQFREGLRVGNVVERLVHAHDADMPVLKEAAMAFIQENALMFHREAMPTLALLKQRPADLMDMLMAITGLLMAGVVPAAHGAAAARAE